MHAQNLECVHVPAGVFDMGTDADTVAWLREHTPWAQDWDAKGGFQAELPRQVALPDFMISAYPVTVGSYRAFVHGGGYVDSRWWSSPGRVWLETSGAGGPGYWENPRWTGDPELPIVGVNWFEAMAYCRWLSQRTGHIYRLPLESEWEKAARGTDRRLYPWGNRYFSGYANVDETYFDMGLTQPEGTTPVDSYPDGVSPYGAYDMAGNVWEWTLNAYDTPQEDSRPDAETRRGMRGGSWEHTVPEARTAARTSASPSQRRYDLGFRVVREM